MKAVLRYIRGVPEDEDLATIRERLSDANVEFDMHDICGQPQNSATDLLAPIVMWISEDFYKSYMAGILASATFEAVKGVILLLWQRASKKELTAVQGGQAQHGNSDIDIIIAQNDRTKLQRRLGSEIPDKLKEHAIDRAFDALGESSMDPQTNYRGVLDTQSCRWLLYSELDFIRKFLYRKKKK